MSNSHTKFGSISSNGLGGDSVMDGQRRTQYPLRFFLKKAWVYQRPNIEPPQPMGGI